MNIKSKNFNKRLIIDEYSNYLEITANLNTKFKKLDYKVFSKENIIQQGILRKYNKNIKLNILLEELETLFISIKIDNLYEYYE